MMFEKALQFVLQNEGGFVNHLNDRGGATNMGITIHTLSDYLGRQATIEEVQNLSLKTVFDIYKKNYWDILRLDRVQHQNLAMALFDQAVNRGTGRVARQIQSIVKVKADGIIGPISLKAINTSDPKKTLIEFIKETQNSYLSIVRNDSSQVIFLQGWMRRSHKLMDMI